MCEIKGDIIFPFHFRALGIGLVIIGVIISGMQMFGGPVLILIGAFLFISRYGYQIDRNAQSIRKYVWFVFKFGSSKKYQSLDYFYITRSKSTMQYGIPITLTATNIVYNAYLLLNGSEEYYLFESKKKESVLKKLSGPAEKLNLQIMNYADQ